MSSITYLQIMFPFLNQASICKYLKPLSQGWERGCGWLKNCRAASDNPAGEDCDDESADIDVTSLAIEDCRDDGEDDNLRDKDNQQGHKRTAEGGGEEKVSARTDLEEEGEVFNQGY